MPDAAEEQLNCTGRAVGKMHDELPVDMARPFDEHFDLASVEGTFHSGDASAPPALALFAPSLKGCFVQQSLGQSDKIRHQLGNPAGFVDI